MYNIKKKIMKKLAVPKKKIPKNINFLMEKCVTPVCTRKSKNRLRGQIIRYFDGMGYIFGILGSNPIGLKVSSLSDL